MAWRSGLGLKSFNAEVSQHSFTSFTPYSLLDNFVKSRSPLVDTFRNALLRLASDRPIESEISPGDSVTTNRVVSTLQEHVHAEHTETSSSKGASLKESFPGVFVILDQFPTGNQMASLQSLAEIGALFPDAITLTQFHQYCQNLL